MPHLYFRSRWIVPLAGPPIENGVVTIDGERIVAVGKSGAGDIVDLGDVVLLPGLINAHTHLEFSDCKKPLGHRGTPLADWIRQVIGVRHRSDRDSSAAVRNGIAESLRHGVTTIGEISTSSPSPYRGLAAYKLLLFQEVIGFSAGRIESVSGDLESRVDAHLNAGLAVGVSPHAPYTVHPELLKRLISFANERRLPVAMHLAESREELQLLRDGTGPFQQLLTDRSMWDGLAIPANSRPLDYLNWLAQAPRSLVVHGNYLDDEEMVFLAENRHRMSVVYCPRTHDYFGHEPYPLRKMLGAGVRVVLGTDSRASSPDLSLLSEMRFMANRVPSVPATAILEMATLKSAQSLGLESEVGSLVPGKLADMVALPCPSGTDPLDAILYSDSEPSHVFIGGQPTNLG